VWKVVARIFMLLLCDLGDLARKNIPRLLLFSCKAAWIFLAEPQSFIEPQSLLSRGDDTCERLRSLRGLRPYEERAERPSVYVERLRRYCG